MAARVDLAKPGRPLHVGVILMNGVTELLDVAPVDLINGLNRDFLDNFPEDLVPPSMKARALDLRFHWVSEGGPAAQSRLTGGMFVTPTDSFETCPALDIALIGAHNIAYTPNAAELAFVRKVWGECSAFISICAGVIVPLQAGVLQGKTATAPRIMLASLRQTAPGTDWVERRWARDGKLWTSGALTNGLDLVHVFAEEYWGGGDGSIVDLLSKLGAWPKRDVDYKDVPWSI